MRTASFLLYNGHHSRYRCLIQRFSNYGLGPQVFFFFCFFLRYELQNAFIYLLIIWFWLLYASFFTCVTLTTPLIVLQ